MNGLKAAGLVLIWLLAIAGVAVWLVSPQEEPEPEATAQEALDLKVTMTYLKRSVTNNDLLAEHPAFRRAEQIESQGDALFHNKRYRSASIAYTTALDSLKSAILQTDSQMQVLRREAMQPVSREVVAEPEPVAAKSATTVQRPPVERYSAPLREQPRSEPPVSGETASPPPAQASRASQISPSPPPLVSEEPDSMQTDSSASVAPSVVKMRASDKAKLDTGSEPAREVEPQVQPEKAPVPPSSPPVVAEKNPDQPSTEAVIARLTNGVRSEAAARKRELPEQQQKPPEPAIRNPDKLPSGPTEAGMLELLKRYERALESRNVASLRVLFQPLFGPRDERDWGRFFKKTSLIEASVLRQSHARTGPYGSVDLVIWIDYVNVKGVRQRPLNYTEGWTLQYGRGKWNIVARSFDELPPEISRINND